MLFSHILMTARISYMVLPQVGISMEQFHRAYDCSLARDLIWLPQHLDDTPERDRIMQHQVYTECLPWLLENFPDDDWAIMTRIIKNPAALEYHFTYQLLTTNADLAVLYKLTWHEAGTEPFVQLPQYSTFEAYQRNARTW